ncbi:hypothetical protein M5D96_002332 [Drosophila gunungcola]|uniref:Uncharacterized protein n=1 Tax=Drosophila gunungcola TaxID=103775 RepID=A0A9Q0BVJ4_9MUSC|nr:hypothetical protein M5D96_002332 [Drosophila gunungcola]
MIDGLAKICYKVISIEPEKSFIQVRRTAPAQWDSIEQNLPDTECDTRKPRIPAHIPPSEEVTAGQWESRWLSNCISVASLATRPTNLTCN